MEIQPDFRDLLQLLNAQKVEYMIVGGYALAFHGAPRYTGDLDILVRPSPENSKRILKALGEFGFGSLGLTENDFSDQDSVVQLGVPPVRVDIITSITGVSIKEIFSNREFVMNKRSTGRKKDLSDLEALGEE